MSIINFSPELAPNSKTGAMFILTENVKVPSDYFVSLKHDGGRVEIQTSGPGLSRERNILKSKHIQEMVTEIQGNTAIWENEHLECEFYSPNMTFAEIMHFFKSSDVTSEKSKKKWANEWKKTNQGTSTYTKIKAGKEVQQGWEFVGRTPEWLTSWHDCLGLYAFNIVDMDVGYTKDERNNELEGFIESYNDMSDEDNLRYIKQHTFQTHEAIQEFYDNAIKNGEEGAFLVRKDAQYKCGRHTMKSGITFKMKEDKLKFKGVIIGVEEATVAKEGSEKSVNNLGRSKTSQKQEDRELSGLAKGFKIRMEDGRELTVSLNKYNNNQKRDLLINLTDWIGKTVEFTGMAPVKHGGVPRQARYTNPNE